MGADLQANAMAPGSPSPTTVPKKKKRKVIWGILVFLWAFWMGWSGWKNFFPKPEAQSFAQWEDKSIAPKVAELRQKLAAVEARPINTVDDYVANTLETWPIVDEAKGLTRRQMAMIARFKQAYPGNAGDARTADYMMRLTGKDEQLIYLLADEVQCAKDLKALPASKRLAYYNANVPPIKDKEAQLMKEWVAIAKDAKANGIPLPAYVDPSAGQLDKNPAER